MSDPSAPNESLWVVSKWEGLTALRRVLSSAKKPQKPRDPEPGLLGAIFRAGESKGDVPERERWLKGAISGVLGAVSECHRRGVAHGSLCSPAVAVTSGFGQDRPIVRLENLGLASVGAGEVRRGCISVI